MPTSVYVDGSKVRPMRKSEKRCEECEDALLPITARVRRQQLISHPAGGGHEMENQDHVCIWQVVDRG